MPRTTILRLILAAMLAALPAPRALSGQALDPRAAFLDALGQFSLALDGTFGDEGPRLSASLDAMADALSRWDAFIQSRERAMAAEIGSADATLASRMQLALGGLYLDRLRVDDALEQLSMARTSDSSRSEVPLLHGLAHAQLTGNNAAAIAALRAAHALDPEDPARSYLLARQLLAAGDEAGADLLPRVQHGLRRGVTGEASAPFIRLDLVRETSGVDPFFPPLAYAEGFAAIRRGDLTKAITALRDSMQRDPLVTPASATDPLVRSAAAFREGRVDDARKSVESVVAQSPDRTEARRMLAMIELADGETARGIGRLKDVIRLRPDDERARLALANALVESEQIEEAEQALLDTIRALPASGRAHYLLGLTYQRQGKRQEALSELQAALSLNPLLGVNTLYRMIGTLHQDEQDLEAAARAFLARAELVPNDGAAHRDLGHVYFLQGDDVQSRAEFEVSLLIDPSDVEAYTSLGQLHLRAGRHSEAAELSRTALELDAAHREARYVHATALIRMGNNEEGAAEMQVFQRLQAQDAEARARTFELGRLRREAAVSRAAGDRENAVALLRRALVYEPTSAASHLDLGIMLLEAGQSAEAIERLNTAVALNAALDVHRHLAKAYAAQGQTEESRKEQALYERLRRESIGRTGRAP